MMTMTTTPKIITDLYVNNQRIGLIKEYRQCTNEGLAESKAAIEANGDSINKMLTLFSPYFEQNQPIPPKIMSDEEKFKKKVIKGMTTACNVWNEMGFPSPLEACQTVLTNIRNNGFNS